MTDPIAAAMLAGAGIDWAKEEIRALASLTVEGAALAVAVIFLLTYIATKSIIKTFTAAICGGLVLFAVASPGWFKDKVGGEFEGTEAGLRAAVVVEAPFPPTPAEVIAAYPQTGA